MKQQKWAIGLTLMLITSVSSAQMNHDQRIQLRRDAIDAERNAAQAQIRYEFWRDVDRGMQHTYRGFRHLPGGRQIYRMDQAVRGINKLRR